MDTSLEETNSPLSLQLLASARLIKTNEEFEKFLKVIPSHIKKRNIDCYIDWNLAISNAIKNKNLNILNQAVEMGKDIKDLEHAFDEAAFSKGNFGFRFCKQMILMGFRNFKTDDNIYNSKIKNLIKKTIKKDEIEIKKQLFENNISEEEKYKILIRCTNEKQIEIVESFLKKGYKVPRLKKWNFEMYNLIEKYNAWNENIHS